MNDTNKLTFLYESIKDTQAVIRAIDTKLSVLMAFLFLPVAGATTSIFSSNPHSLFPLPWVIAIVATLGALTWAACLTCCLQGLGSISMPVLSAKQDLQVSGLFFPKSLIRFRPIHILKDPKPELPGPSLASAVRATNDLDADGRLIAELNFELSKLSFIRDTKLFRQKWAYRFFSTYVAQLVTLLAWILAQK